MRWVASALWFLVVIGCILGGAAVPAQELGRVPEPEEILEWDLSISPEGRGLPPGSGAALDGERVYAQICVECHGEGGVGARFEALVGGEGTLATTQPVKTVVSYWPYATTLFDYIRRAMPFDRPGTLTEDQLYGVVAYILHLGGVIEEQAVLDAETLPDIQMPNRFGFVADP